MMPFQRILFPIDFSEAATAMVSTVTEMAQRFQASVTVLNAFNLVHEYDLAPGLEESWELEPPAIPYMPAMQALRDQREQRLEEFARAHFSGIELKTRIEDGDPARVIEWAAKHEQSDLIIMPTRGLGKFRRMLLGSVTAKVLHDVDCPVFTSAHEPDPKLNQKNGFQSILCAVRMDAESESVLKMMAFLARVYGARVCLVHVNSSSDPKGQEVSAELVRQAFEQASNLDRDMATRVRILDAAFPEGIRQTAIEEAADLVIVGRGCARNSVSSLWSHLYTVIREAPCPVLSV